MSDPTQAAPAADTATPQATSTAAPVVEPPASAPASAPAQAPAEPSTLLTDPPKEDQPSTEAKPEGEAKEGDKEKPKTDDDKDAHAPEEYADFELPDGLTLDENLANGIKPLFKELDLPQGKAQKLAQFAAQEQKKAATAFVADLQSNVDKQAKAWEAAVQADPELGGANHKEVMAVARKALDEFGSPEFAKFLRETRLGSNPDMVRMLHKVGKAISQDSVTSGRTGNGTVKQDAEVFYGNKS